MKVTGIQKLTLLDYPGVVACTVFTAGCNFRCPFCHNAMLVLPEQIDDECLTDDEVFGFLKKRSVTLMIGLESARLDEVLPLRAASRCCMRTCPSFWLV